MKKRKRIRSALPKVVNMYGIVINKACMSCAFKDYTRSDKLRYCCHEREQVDKYHLCDRWLLSEQLKMAGSAKGVVRDIVTKEEVIV